MYFSLNLKLPLLTVLSLPFLGCTSYQQTLYANNYDHSTLAAKNVTVPSYTKTKGTIFPMLNAPSLISAMVEAKSFASSTSSRFFYRFADNKSKRTKSFFFEGGDIYALSRALKDKNLFGDVRYGNTLIISSTKKFTVNIAKDTRKGYEEIRKKLRNIPGVSKMRITTGAQPKIKYTATPHGLEAVKKTIHAYNRKKGMSFGVKVGAAMSLNEIVKKLYPYNVISHFEGENYIVNSNGVIINTITDLNRLLNKRGKSIQKRNVVGENGEKMISFAISRYAPIILDHPYTIRTIVQELGKRKGIDYEVMVDSNIPVNKHVQINKLADLNRYLKDTTGQTIRTSKGKNGVVKVHSGGHR